MPEDLPDRLEAGTLNVPGIAGLCAGICYVRKLGCRTILAREAAEAKRCAEGLRDLEMQVFTGDCQAGTVSFLPREDLEDFAQKLAKKGIAVRAGLHCAPTAHQSAGTLQTGTVRVSFGHDAAPWQTDRFLRAAQACFREKYLQ
jgi:selenocysteine lyase/cysteine desulfurase